MSSKLFENMNYKDLNETNGGGIVGATIGYLTGNVVGLVVAGIAYANSCASGSSPDKASKAFLTVYTSTVATCTIVGGIATTLV